MWEKEQVRRKLQNLCKENDANTMIAVESKWHFKDDKDKADVLS